jgi:hypothetical protein
MVVYYGQRRYQGITLLAGQSVKVDIVQLFATYNDDQNDLMQINPAVSQTGDQFLFQRNLGFFVGTHPSG